MKNIPEEETQKSTLHTEYQDVVEDRLNKILTEIKGSSRLQLFATASITSGMLGSSFWWYNIAYLLKQPVYICTFAENFP